MAEKRSKSIISGLKNMLHRDSGKPSGPAAKPVAPARKKPAASVAEKAAPAKESVKDQPAAAASADAPADQKAAPEARLEKKVKTQPWYRHRQRW
ncbi:MAG TPA: hypothetical protein VLV56_02395 [Burkholderiales bacterium]|nr:hypothetical protein [Burkholderiales bacterium]